MILRGPSLIDACIALKSAKMVILCHSRPRGKCVFLLMNVPAPSWRVGCKNRDTMHLQARSTFAFRKYGR
jgi:hypothetical protein